MGFFLRFLFVLSELSVFRAIELYSEVPLIRPPS